MRVHLISIGGAVMHNIALELQRNGHQVSGSDDEIFEPSRSRLESAGLLPQEMGWFAEQITTDIDVVVLGMHARIDNPELLKAQELGLDIQSFPEFVYNQSQSKKRVVIAGSHGKTTTTAMVMHILKAIGMDFDYLVGSKLDGFDLMVRLSDAPIIILEGDEYLSSPIDRRSKFMWYKPDVAVITGIAWDHINVFPTFEGYVNQFREFGETIKDDGTLIYYQHDEHINSFVKALSCHLHAYQAPEHQNNNGGVVLTDDGIEYALKIFGQHNLENMEAALQVTNLLGVSRQEGLRAMEGFGGTARRLENVYDNNGIKIYRDFAHSPSKVRATVEAVKSTYPNHKVVAVLELHTFSSLNEAFLPLYNGAMDKADIAYVHYNAHVFEMKKMKVLSESDVAQNFGNVIVQTSLDDLWEQLQKEKAEETVYLMMSSGNFGGKNVLDLA